MIDIINDDEILAYLDEHGLEAEKTESGIYYLITDEGGRKKPTLKSKVTCHYRGYLTNGNTFDSSFDRGKPSTFPLRQVIAGWQEGIPLFGKGGKGSLFIPSRHAYVSNPPGVIPADAVLIFDIELIDF